MTSIASLTSQPIGAGKSDDCTSLRQGSPTLSANSGAQLVSTPGVELPFFASYEARAPAREEVLMETGSARWGSRRK